MDIDKLRALIKEEVQNALVEHGTIGMDHARFRRVVSKKMGRELGRDEAYNETWMAWGELIREGGQHPDASLVETYVGYALELLHEDM